MGRKAEVEVPYKLYETDYDGNITELGEVDKINEATVEADVSDVAEARVFVYVGPTIRGVITNGGIYAGTAQEISKHFEKSIEKYPQIKRLIVADRSVAKAKEQLNDKKGLIYVNYAELVRQIGETDKEG